MKRPSIPSALNRPQPPPIRRRLRVRGIVQGVGFRPHVYALATRLGLTGFVGNDGSGVFVEIEGPEQALDRFHAELQEKPPPLASIELIEVEPAALRGERTFRIVASEEGQGSSATQRTFVSPDQSLCADCRRELFDPRDRRYRYPFINCTNCGPRFTIIRGMPYDRLLTTMSGFAMCGACRREYDDPANRRFHAQPIACPLCGPQLAFQWSVELQADHRAAEPPAPSGQLDSRAAARSESRTISALVQAQRVLAEGKVLAVKGLGGYHLACNAADEQAVALLRARKGRAGKPFAVMAANLEVARRIAHVDEAEAAMLAGGVRPIVLLRKQAGAGIAGSVAGSVAPGNGYLGVMLPYTPLHELLFCDLANDAPPDVLVMTSGNLSEEPIAWCDEDAVARLSYIADAFLLHDRPIHAPCDDSVVRIFEGRELPVRRARGYAPMPILLPLPPGLSRDRAGLALLATGADLKSTFCLTQGQHAILSQHIGDMGNVETYEAFTRAVEHLQELFRIRPEVLACDAHPGYLSTRWAQEHADGRQVIAVQHHHAHIAALMAEQAAVTAANDEPVIGFSFDGTGYGSDGAIWGGEVMLATYSSFARRAHLRYLPLPGGDAAVRRPYRTALAHLWAADVEWAGSLPPVRACPSTELALLRRQLETGLNCVPTSSMGRLCDAVAALAGVCQTASYEAQAAIELEALVDSSALAQIDELGDNGYAFRFLDDGEVTIVDPAPLVRQVAADVQGGRPAGWIATHFHAALVRLIVQLSHDVRAQTGIGQVALSGGVFQNVVLLGGAVSALRRAGFTVLMHRHVPPNDAGLALGQAIVAARQLFR